PAPLSVTAASRSKVYGVTLTSANYTGTLTGVVAGDNITASYDSPTGDPANATVAGSTYAIIASLSDPGNRLANYTVTNTSAALTVTPAPLSVTAASRSKVYGVTLTSANYTGTLTGVVAGDTITASYDSPTGDPGNATVAGSTYAIIAALSDPGNRLANYTVTNTSGKLTVTPAPLTVTANPATRAYGFPDPTFTATISGFVLGQTLATSGVTGSPSLSSNDTVNSPVGTYTITPAVGTLSASNYAFTTFNTGTLTVTLSPAGASVFVLDGSAGGALNLSGNAGINIAGDVVVDSSSSSAILASGNATVTAPYGVLVVGGVSKSGNASVTRTGTPGATGDPLAGLPIVTGGTVRTAVNLSGKSSLTINPGIYGQITVSGNASLTMSAGVYIIAGGGFNVSGNASVTGSGVMIYNAGTGYNPATWADGGTFGSIALTGNGTVSLTPASTGNYAGILIFQARDNSKALTLSGNATQGISGAIYALKAQVVESGNAQVGSASNPVSIVVDTMSMSGNSVANIVSLSSPTGTVAYTPAQIRAAYGISSLTLDGSGQTIAIVDAYDDPSIFRSLDAFDAQFGLTDSGPTLYGQYGPASSFLTVLNQNGQATSLPTTDPNGPGTANWELETALDVEWIHAIAPGAQIVLVEASSQTLPDLMAGVATAASQPGVSVVSMSWGFPEGQAVFAADEASYDSVFNVPGVTFLASTGDYGTADPEYPAFSPNVVAVGGTSLILNSDHSYNSETGWGYYADSLGMSIGSGGGISLYQPEPAYQQGVQSTGFRTTPDVSLVADPATGAWIADSYNLDPSNPFEVAGGTSLSAPAFAGLFALANQGRVAAGEGTLNRSTPTETQQALYMLPQSDYNVIASGSNGYTADTGYNLVTGLGTPVANLMVPDLIAYHGPGTTYAGPTVSPLQDATLHSNWAGGGGTSNAFNAFDALTATGSGFSEVQSPDASLAMSRAPSLVNLTPAVAVAATTTAATAIGSSFALSIGSFSLHGPAQSLGSISNSTSGGLTTAPLAGVASTSLSTGLAAQMPVWSTPRLAVSLPGAVEHQDVFSGMDRQNLHADAIVLARTRRGLVAESVLDDVAANLLLARGEDGAAPASVPALPPTGVTVALDATGPGLQQDQDVPSATSAAGLVVFGLAAGLWAARGPGILNARKRQSGSRSSRGKSLDFRPGKEAW
ncbi:MAG: MBG domain-containing protein, partial [Candidatus Limnocylindrales bacterium]